MDIRGIMLYFVLLLLLALQPTHPSKHQIRNAIHGKFVNYRFTKNYNGFRDIRSNLFYKNFKQESLTSYSTLYLTIKRRSCSQISPITCISCDTFGTHHILCPSIKLEEKVYVNILHDCMPLMKKISNNFKNINCTNLNIQHLSWTFG